MVGDDEEVGPVAQSEFLQAFEDEADLAVVVADRGQRLGRADGVLVLGAVGLGEPVEHDVGLELGEDVLAQDALGVVDLRVRVGLGLRRRRPEAGQDLVADRGRVGERPHWADVAGVDHHARAARRAGD